PLARNGAATTERLDWSSRLHPTAVATPVVEPVVVSLLAQRRHPQAPADAKAAAGGHPHTAGGDCALRPDPIVCCTGSARLLLFSRRRGPDDPNGDEGVADSIVSPATSG